MSFTTVNPNVKMVFETTDGKTFVLEKDANQHQGTLDIEQKITALLNDQDDLMDTTNLEQKIAHMLVQKPIGRVIYDLLGNIYKKSTQS